MRDLDFYLRMVMFGLFIILGSIFVYFVILKIFDHSPTFAATAVMFSGGITVLLSLLLTAMFRMSREFGEFRVSNKYEHREFRRNFHIIFRKMDEMSQDMGGLKTELHELRNEVRELSGDIRDFTSR